MTIVREGDRLVDFYRSGTWLGAAWKAMPADLSRPRLGERTLDLLDDMSNWGGKTQLLGEVDVFKVDHTHELYGAMNINYVRLDRVPAFDGDWSPLLGALRAGEFFVTTGEILLRDVGVYRDRIDVSTTPPFAQSVLVSRPDLRGRRWARVEVWDVARNGAFSQPIWIEGGPR